MRFLAKIKSLIVLFILISCAGTVSAGELCRIVSLAPSVTDSLYLLDSEKFLAGVTSFCRQSPNAEIVGTLTNPNMEKVFSLQPNFVFTVRGINRARAIERLKSLGINVVVFKESQTLEDILANFIRLSEIVGKKDKALEIVDEVREKVDIISALAKEKDPKRVFLEINKRPLVTASAGSFMNEFLKYSGSVNIFSDINITHPRVSREEVLKRDPEAILLVNMGDVRAEDKKYWQTFKDLSAVRNDQIFYVDSDKFCRPTPVSFLNSLREITCLLHPELSNGKDVV
ncbi:MAG: ABC transporter substrate-binding protein [Candidatus Omnitrophica bacterium]|nr:ABC transporter substrate-binding protein [Candidatus Omnitrophota bacterium]